MLTLGRLPKALDVAVALHGAGWRVIIAEPSQWHLARVSRSVSKCFAVTSPNDDQEAYVQDLLNVIRSENVSLVVPISEEALHATLIEDKLPDGVALFSMPHESLRLMHDKSRFIKLAESYDLVVPQTHLLGTKEAEELAQSEDYVIKPVCTCSGQGLQICKQGDTLPTASELSASVVQSFLGGALKSSFSIAHKGRVIGSVVYRAAILSGTVAVAFEKLNEEADIENWISSFVKHSNYSGFISFDFIEDPSGQPRAIECNPRATSGIHFVEPKSIANAILDPERCSDLDLKPHTIMQQFYPSLTETQVAAFRRDQFLKKIRILATAKEVNFAWRDPLPLWLMPFTSWNIMKRAFLKGESFGEASTYDIAWFE